MSIKIPHAELVNYGCRNCVWRLHNQCPHGITEEDVKEDKLYSFSEKLSEDCTLQKSVQSKRSSTLHNESHTDNSITITGYCQELREFIFNFAEGEDSISAVWEKFSIYMAKLQSMEDYKTYKQLENTVREMEDNYNGLNTEDKQQLEYLQSRKDALKLWWSKLNSQVLFSLSKVVDREKKLLEKSARPVNYINAKQVNFNSAKQLEQTAGDKDG